jgi:hypothetical protein
MTRILLLIGLLCIAIVSSAQETQKAGLPPIRTSDKSPLLPKTAVALPIKSGGNKSQPVAAQAVPLRKGGASKSTGQPAANSVKTVPSKIIQSKPAQTPSTLAAGKVQQQSLPASGPGKP